MTDLWKEVRFLVFDAPDAETAFEAGWQRPLELHWTAHLMFVERGDI
jgi:hypothetical protein